MAAGKKQFEYPILTGILAILSGFAAGAAGLQFYHSYYQPAQNPQAISWGLLGDAYRATAKPEDSTLQAKLQQVRALQGERVALFGYMMPIKAGERHHQFVLSPQTNSCPFCTPATAGNLVEVTMNQPIPYYAEAILVRGRLQIREQGSESGFFYLMDQARHVPD
jgi:uncharacterized protein